MENLSFKKKLYNVVDLTYKSHPKHNKIMQFRVLYGKKSRKSFGAKYLTNDKTIVVNLDGINYEDLLMSVLIHEASHHIQTVLTGSSHHDKKFREIQEALLFTAMDKKYISPHKLILCYKYLSEYSERNKVIKMLMEYIKIKHIKKDVWLLAYYNVPYNKELIENYFKKEGFKFCKFKATENVTVWYKFSPNRLLVNKGAIANGGVIVNE